MDDKKKGSIRGRTTILGNSGEKLLFKKKIHSKKLIDTKQSLNIRRTGK